MKFITSQSDLTIKMEGWEVLLSLRRKIVIPKSKITKLIWQANYRYEGRRMIRLGGTALPRVILAGNFRGSVGWYFLYVHNPREARWRKEATFSASDILDIELSNHFYKRIIVECDAASGNLLAGWQSS